MTDQPPGPRFLTLPQVAEELATSQAQILALIKRGDLSALQMGGRGQWRIERARLEDYIARCYEETDRRRGAPTDGARKTAGGDPDGRGNEV